MYYWSSHQPKTDSGPSPGSTVSSESLSEVVPTVPLVDVICTFGVRANPKPAVAPRPTQQFRRNPPPKSFNIYRIDVFCTIGVPANPKWIAVPRPARQFRRNHSPKYHRQSHWLCHHQRSRHAVFPSEQRHQQGSQNR